MTDIVHIDTQTLHAMSEVAGSVARSLRELGAARFDPAPRVTQALTDLADRWDNHRDELADELDGLAATTAEIAAVMLELDTNLASALGVTSADGGTQP